MLSFIWRCHSTVGIMNPQYQNQIKGSINYFLYNLQNSYEFSGKTAIKTRESEGLRLKDDFNSVKLSF